MSIIWPGNLLRKWYHLPQIRCHYVFVRCRRWFDQCWSSCAFCVDSCWWTRIISWKLPLSVCAACSESSRCEKCGCRSNALFQIAPSSSLPLPSIFGVNHASSSFALSRCAFLLLSSIALTIAGGTGALPICIVRDFFHPNFGPSASSQSSMPLCLSWYCSSVEC